MALDECRLNGMTSPIVTSVGAIVELQAPRDVPDAHGNPRHLVFDGPDQLAVTGRLFAETSASERLTCDRLAIGIGVWRRGAAAIWKRYVGPPPTREDPIERDQFLDAYRLTRRDIEDAVNQMLGRDPEQHRPPRLSWETLIELLSDHGVELSESELISMPFRCELSPAVEAELARSG